MPFYGPEASLTLRYVIASCELFNNSSYDEIGSKTEVRRRPDIQRAGCENFHKVAKYIKSILDEEVKDDKGEGGKGGGVGIDQSQSQVLSLDQKGANVSGESNKDTVAETEKVVKSRGLRTRGKQHARSRGGQCEGRRGSARGPRVIENAASE